jgi:serine/threonine protein kinase/tetratricopeptide (TPR) repeat protein
MQDREERLMGLAQEALRTPSAQRESFLRAACHEDKDFYSEVSEIVEWEERMGDFMRDPLVGLIDLEALDRPFKPDQVVADRFEIIREVGDGGMGVVYEAYDRKRQQRIAIKCAKLGYERLSPELRGALKVRHPNVCLVNEIHTAATDLGELDFLTMEFLDGETLLSRLSRGKLEHDEAFRLARQLCAGLAEAHRCGVLHRDLKPANVILSPGENKELRAVITDFGLAADQDGNTDLIGGTPSYMAPELMQDGTASPASDIYALGVILHEMVTASKPFAEAANTNGEAQLYAVSNKPIKHLPRIWADAIRPCLETRPEKRPSAEQIVAVLDRKPIYRRPWVPIAALVLLATGAFLWRPIYEYSRPADISLAILPVQTTGDLQNIGESVLHDVTQRLAHQPKGKPKFRLIPLATVQNKRVRNPEQAQSLLHATHVLQLELHRDGNGVAAEAAVVDLKSQAHVRDYSGHFSEADLGDLPGGLTGAITASLHLKRAAVPESISSHAVAPYKAGRNYLREGRYSFDQAIAQFQQAAQQDAHSPLPQAGLAEAYVFKYRVQNDSQALKQATIHLQAAEKLDSDSPSVRLAAAWLNIFSNKNAQAMEDCSRTLEVDPRNSQAWMLCGYLYDIEGIDNKALEYFHKAIALDPTYFRPYQFLGGFYNARAQYAEAEGQYKKEVEFALNDLDGLSDLASVLTEQGKYAEAEQVFRKSLSIKATPASLNDLGATLAFIGRDAEALPYYRQAAALEAPNYTYWINIGDAERRLGDSNGAKIAYRKGLALASAHLEMNPNSYQARAYMAYVQARLGQNGNARSGIAQAMQSPDKDKQILLCAILTYEALGDREQALKLVNQIPPGMKITIQHHPDLADLRRDLRYIQVTGNSK